MAKKSNKENVTDLGTLEMSAGFAMAETGVAFFQSRNKPIPQYETEYSAGLDIRADLEVGDEVNFHNHANVKAKKTVRGEEGQPGKLYIEPGDRVLVPTGLHADIPEGFYLAIHSRSGTSWKQGLILTNGVAVIDADYVDEIFVSLTNISGSRVVIEDGDRIAQFVLNRVERLPGGINKRNTKPEKKTSRAGGFGSTGVK